jgi:hypothetical protein
MTVPVDPNAQGVSGGTGSGSGTWVGFWLLDQPAITGTQSTREVDVEIYGVGNNQFPATSQWWPLTGPTVHNYWQSQISGLPVFQGVSTKFGILLDQFNVTWYVNDVVQKVLPLFAPDSPAPMYMMIDLGMGGGWPIIPPVSPATSYPLIVKSAKIWEAPMSTTVTGVTSLSATPTSTTTMSITYSTGGSPPPPPPTFTPASSPTTTGAAVSLGTVAPGTTGDTLTVSLTSDATFSTGSSIALSGTSIMYTPGTITSGNAGSDSVVFAVHDTTNGTTSSFTVSVTLSFVSGGSGPVVAHSVSANAGSGTSLVLPALNVPANSVIVLFATVTFQTLTTVADSSGLTWTLRKVENPGFYPVYEYWASTIAAISADVITLTFSGSGSVLSAVAAAVTGCTSLSAPFDTNASLPAGTGSEPATISTTSANTLVVAAFRGNTAVSTAGAGCSLIEPSAGFLMTQKASFSSAQTSLAVHDGISGDAIAVIADALR